MIMSSEADDWLSGSATTTTTVIIHHISVHQLIVIIIIILIIIVIVVAFVVLVIISLMMMMMMMTFVHNVVTIQPLLLSFLCARHLGRMTLSPFRASVLKPNLQQTNGI